MFPVAEASGKAIAGSLGYQRRANPPLCPPLPKRTLGGTNFSDDIEVITSSMAESGEAVACLLPAWSEGVDSGVNTRADEEESDDAREAVSSSLSSSSWGVRLLGRVKRLTVVEL